MASQYGCGRTVTVILPALGETRVHCGGTYAGELVQCEECQESKPAPSSADPADDDARAELEAERAFTGRRTETKDGDA